jgi:hypothetical protein
MDGFGKIFTDSGKKNGYGYAGIYPTTETVKKSLWTRAGFFTDNGKKVDGCTNYLRRCQSCLVRLPRLAVASHFGRFATET